MRMSYDESPKELIFQYRDDVRARFPKRQQMEEAILFLKQNGFNLMNSEIILELAYNLSAKESKLAVRFSQAWQTDLHTSEVVRNSAKKALEEGTFAKKDNPNLEE
jgi:hypothetical protein